MMCNTSQSIFKMLITWAVNPPPFPNRCLTGYFFLGPNKQNIFFSLPHCLIWQRMRPAKLTKVVLHVKDPRFDVMSIRSTWTLDIKPRDMIGLPADPFLTCLYTESVLVAVLVVDLLYPLADYLKLALVPCPNVRKM